LILAAPTRSHISDDAQRRRVRDHSLDEFAGADDDGDDREATGPPEHESESESESESEVAPATATSRWDPDGGVCPSCGERAGRRWRAAEGEAEAPFVCTDCKDW
jgi:hypothetical protein